MAHFAQLNNTNTVTRVVVINNVDILDQYGQESEQIGIGTCKALFGDDTTWLQTSYNGSFRKNYAGPGFTYDSNSDAFIPPQPYQSWKLEPETFQWIPPSPYPDDGGFYRWDESSLSWIPINI